MGKYDKCPRYWRGCFECKYYLGSEHLYFCKAYNRRIFGQDTVEVEVEMAMPEAPRKPECWWAERVDKRKRVRNDV